MCHYIIMIVLKDTSVRHTKTTRPCNLCFNVDFKTTRINFHYSIEKQKAVQKPSPDCMSLQQPWEEDFILLLIFLFCAKTHSPAAMP